MRAQAHPRQSVLGSRLSLDRQPHGERAALARLALDAHVPMVRFDNVAHHGEPDASAFDLLRTRIAAAYELPENIVLLVHGNPEATVAHANDDRVALNPQVNPDP